MRRVAAGCVDAWLKGRQRVVSFRRRVFVSAKLHFVLSRGARDALEDVGHGGGVARIARWWPAAQRLVGQFPEPALDQVCQDEDVGPD